MWRLKNARSLRYLGIVFQVGLGFVASIVVAIFLGAYFDKRFGTSPFLLVLFLLSGLAAGFASAIQTLKKVEHDIRKKDRE